MRPSARPLRSGVDALPPGLAHVERFQVAFDRDQRCPYCRSELERDRAALAVCLACKTLLHVTCAEHHGGCTTVGCVRGRQDAPRAPEPRRAPAEPGRLAPLLLAVLLCGGATWLLGGQLARLWPAGGPPPAARARVDGLEVRAHQEGALIRLVGAVALSREPERFELSLTLDGTPVPVSWCGGRSVGFSCLVPTPPTGMTRRHVLRASLAGDPPVVQAVDVMVAPARAVVEPARVPCVVSVGPTPAPAAVMIQAPDATEEETLFLGATVSRAIAWARITVRGPGGQTLAWEAALPGEVQAAVTLPGPGQHVVEVEVTLPDGRSAVARHQVWRR